MSIISKILLSCLIIGAALGSSSTPLFSKKDRVVIRGFKSNEYLIKNRLLELKMIAKRGNQILLKKMAAFEKNVILAPKNVKELQLKIFGDFEMELIQNMYEKELGMKYDGN